MGDFTILGFGPWNQQFFKKLLKGNYSWLCSCLAGADMAGRASFVMNVSFILVVSTGLATPPGSATASRTGVVWCAKRVWKKCCLVFIFFIFLQNVFTGTRNTRQGESLLSFLCSPSRYSFLDFMSNRWASFSHPDPLTLRSYIYLYIIIVIQLLQNYTVYMRSELYLLLIFSEWRPAAG